MGETHLISWTRRCIVAITRHKGRGRRSFVALLCVCFARLLQPGVKAGLFFSFSFLQRRVKVVTMEDGMFSTRRAISSPFTTLPLLRLGPCEVCFIGGPLGHYSDRKTSGRDLRFAPNQMAVISCLLFRLKIDEQELPPLLFQQQTINAFDPDTQLWRLSADNIFFRH